MVSKKVLLFKLIAVLLAVGAIAGVLYLKESRKGKKSVLFPHAHSLPRVPVTATPPPTPAAPPTPTPRPQATQLPAFGPGMQARIEEAQRLADQRRRQELNRQFLQLLTDQRDRLVRAVPQELRRQMLENPEYASRLDEKFHTMKYTLPPLKNLLNEFEQERRRFAYMLNLNTNDFRFPIDGEGIIQDLLNQNLQLPPGDDLIDPEKYAYDQMQVYDLSLDGLIEKLK